MRIIMMHRQDPDYEAGIPPSPELGARMGVFVGEAMQSGVLISGEGLQNSSKRVRVKLQAGNCTVENGPYAGSNELISGFVMIKVRSQDEAVQWAKRLGKALGDVEIEAGQVTEAWDLGFGPKPEGAPLRFLLLEKADRNSEAGIPLPSNVVAGVTALFDEMKRAGVFLTAERIQPSSKGTRLRIRKNAHTATDGPFTESKELIGGYALMQLESVKEAVDWATRFAEVLIQAKPAGVVEVDIRPIDEAWQSLHAAGTAART